VATEHKTLYHQPGIAAQISQIWILQSLADEELQTGTSIRTFLTDTISAHGPSLGIVFKKVHSRTELHVCLGELRANIERTGHNAILDIECHGNSSGLELTDGSIVTWDELRPSLQSINIASRFNLLLVLACCDGGYFGSSNRLHELSSFSVIATLAHPSWRDTAAISHPAREACLPIE
jgi:hypothetical protein